MDKEEALLLKNTIKGKAGIILINYLQDFLTDSATDKGRNSETLRGMCEIVQKIKKIPQEVK